MVMAPYSLLFRETIELFYKRYKYSYPRSMVEEVSHQFVSLVSEKKRDMLI
jgi:hypothetical protein